MFANMEEIRKQSEIDKSEVQVFCDHVKNKSRKSIYIVNKIQNGSSELDPDDEKLLLQLYREFKGA
jgi:hypothetical protein